MDLRTIMNADSAAAASSPPPLQPLQHQHLQHHQHHQHPPAPSPPPLPPVQPRARPPPPPPLLASASTILPGIPPPPPASQQPFLPHAGSPFTPQPLSTVSPHPQQHQQSYFSQPRALSVHSATTPSSVRSFSFAAPRDNDAAASQPHGDARAPPELLSPLMHTPSTSGSGSGSARAPVSSLVDQPHRQYLLDAEFDRQRASLSPKSSSSLVRPPSIPVADLPRVAPDRPSQGLSPHDASRPLWLPNTNNARTTTHDAAAQPPRPFFPPTTPKTSRPPSSSRPPTISPTSRPSAQRDPDPSALPLSTPMKPVEYPAQSPASAAHLPKKKRKRYHEPPIYARKAPRSSGTPPSIPVGFKPPPPSFLPTKPPPSKRAVSEDRPTSRNTSLPPRLSLHTSPAQTDAEGSVARPKPVTTPVTSLGPWEPSVTGVIPHEEVTKLICDFLFQQVVMRKDIGGAPAGGAATGSGAILEVEAKLGQLVDKNRGERLRLPVLTECVISRDDPHMRLAFESSMSLAQHRSLNNFLNETVKASMVPGSSRIPLTYAHKKERDTFYEISPAALPPLVQHHLNPRHKPKVRVTTDQRTGEILARIIKCRIADMDVHSPRTNLDWRISVNLEMNFDGDASELIPIAGMGDAPVPAAGGKRTGSRNKDRMSYRHLAYQIDLTQVATAELATASPPLPTTDFEHELEIEISSAEIRRQGDLALAGDPSNQYEELIKGFVDNVRVLARAVPGRF
ncbi:hypothetical protein LOZ36_004802 [Ophidiomyces ophidiicola]|nr:hypothetical protein LOZ36_004802 [Ophidiomyces ophidiicola]